MPFFTNAARLPAFALVVQVGCRKLSDGGPFASWFRIT
jgi:hypothetical protein